MRRAMSITAACLALTACSGEGEGPDAAASSSASTSISSAPEYTPTAAEQKLIDAVYEVLERNGGGADGPAGAVLSEVRYSSAAGAVDLVSTWPTPAAVDNNTAETLCAVVDLAEVQVQSVLEQTSLDTRVTNEAGTTVHACS